MGFLAWGLANAAMAQSGPVPEVSGANPLYLYAHFADDDVTHLRIAHSRDARSYSEIDELGVYAARSFRDPSIMLVPGANSSLPGTYYVLATPSTACRVQFVSSDDLIAFKTGPVIDMSIYVPDCQTAWAPEWWQDPNGNTYFWISVGTAPYSYKTRKTPYLVQFDPLSGSVIGTPVAVELNGTTQDNTFRLFSVLRGRGDGTLCPGLCGPAEQRGRSAADRVRDFRYTDRPLHTADSAGGRLF